MEGTGSSEGQTRGAGEVSIRPPEVHGAVSGNQRSGPLFVLTERTDAVAAAAFSVS